MPDETIAPALTPDEWAAERKDLPNGDAVYVHRGQGGAAHFVVQAHDTWRGEPYTGAISLSPARAKAIAALALYGQPFGFTEADVALVRRAAAGADAYTVDEWERWSSLADRIAALLPR